MACLLVDNGSLRAGSTVALRHIARRLGSRIGRIVEPVSLLHSSAVDAADLDGIPAEVLEPAIRSRYARGAREFVMLPLFFGPSAALTDYLPRRIQAVSRDLPGLSVRVGRCLVDPEGSEPSTIAGALADRVRSTITASCLRRPAVVLVDHGSPQPAVGAIRNQVAREMAQLLGEGVSSVRASSMERREGNQYDFNEPLLADALTSLPEEVGDVVVSLMFFSPGRHAGPGGDIEQICSTAAQVRPRIRLHVTDVIGDHPLVVETLAVRFHEIVHRLGAP